MKRIFFKRSDVGETPPIGYESFGFNSSSVPVKSNNTSILDKIVESADINASVTEFISASITTDDKPTYLFCEGVFDGISVEADTTSSYDVTVTGIKRNQNSSPGYYIENHKGLISNYDGNTFLMGKTNSIIYDSIQLNQAGQERLNIVSSQLSTKFLTNSLLVEVTGLSSSTVQWSAKTTLQVISNNSVGVTNSNIKTFDYVYNGLDFLEDDTYRPTTYQLDYYGSATGSDVDGYADTNFRASRDAFYKSQNELFLRRIISPSYSVNIDSFPDATIYNKVSLKKVKIACWSEYLSDISEPLYTDDDFIKNWTTPSNLINIWFEPSPNTGLKPSDVLPGVNIVNILPGVDENNIPITGNPGDVLPVFDIDPLDPSSSFLYYYAWDQANNEFNSTFYNDYFEQIQNTKRERGNSISREFSSLILSIQPFLWASEYIPSYRVKKDL
jgi:hypothetical protein